MGKLLIPQCHKEDSGIRNTEATNGASGQGKSFFFFPCSSQPQENPPARQVQLGRWWHFQVSVVLPDNDPWSRAAGKMLPLPFRALTPCMQRRSRKPFPCGRLSSCSSWPAGHKRAEPSSPQRRTQSEGSHFLLHQRFPFQSESSPRIALPSAILAWQQPGRQGSSRRQLQVFHLVPGLPQRVCTKPVKLHLLWPKWAARFPVCFVFPSTQGWKYWINTPWDSVLWGQGTALG